MTIRGYYFYYRPVTEPESEWEQVNFVPEPAEDFLITGLHSGTAYEIASKAVDLAGNESEMSEPLAVSTDEYLDVDTPVSAEQQMHIDNLCTSYMEEVGLANTVALVVTGPEGSYSKIYGAYKTLDYHFWMGSISKTFTATAVFQCIQDGLFTLDTTLDTFNFGLPGWALSSITIRHLLQMRAGIFDYTQDSSFGLMMYLWPTSSNFTNGFMLSLAYNHGQIFPPGAAYYYCNTNYLLLALIVEKVREKPIKQVIYEDILDPMGLNETDWSPGVSPPAPTMHGYGWDMLFGNMCILGGRRDQTFFYGEAFMGSGNCTTTIGDLSKWAHELRDGTLLDPEIHAMRWEQYSVSQQAPVEEISAYGYGLGWVSYGNYEGHDGSIMGFSSVCMFDRETHATIAAVENFQTPGLAIMAKLTPRVMNYLYPERAGTPNYPRYINSLKSSEKFGEPIVGDLTNFVQFVCSTAASSATGYFTPAGVSYDMNLPEDTAVVFAEVSMGSQAGLGAWVQCGGKDMVKLATADNGVSLYYLLDPPTGATVKFSVGISGWGFNNCWGHAFAYKGVNRIGTVQSKTGSGSSVTHRVPLIGSDYRELQVLAHQAGTVTNYSGAIRDNGSTIMIGDSQGNDNADQIVTASVPTGSWWSFLIPVRP